MWKVQTRIYKGMEVVTYYASNQWDFDNKNQVLIRAKMTKAELTKYKIDAEGIDVFDYFEKSCLGARRYLLHRGDETLEFDRKVMRM